ncbi:MAG: phosphopyruvate hydratase [Nanoarchaeota archaeon]
MHTIKNIKAKEILDSRGNPTIEVEIWLEKGYGKTAVPSGASIGKYESLELRDGGKRYKGLGVLKAVKNVNYFIKASIIGKKFSQKTLDNKLIKLDGTKNKSKLGANAILGVSLAFAHAAADEEKIPLYIYFKNLSVQKKLFLPVPMFNILNGGKHASNGLDVQEFMILPLSAKSFKEAIKNGYKVFDSLKKILISKGLSTKLGDEGGYAPFLNSNELALELICQAIKEAGLIPGKDIYLAIDVASSEFYKNGKYNLKKDKKVLDRGEIISLYNSWIKKYPIISIEDPLQQDDWKGYSVISKNLEKNILIIGDDLFVTHKARLKNGIKYKSANAILIKLNQVGTVSETIDVVNLAKKAGYTCIISHRSGETMDTSISDLTVGLGVKFIKAGSVHNKERLAKYNRLLEIEKKLGKKTYLSLHF